MSDCAQPQEDKHVHKSQGEDQIKPLPAPQARATTLPDPQPARTPLELVAPALRTRDEEQNAKKVEGNCDATLAGEVSGSKVTTEHENQDKREANWAASGTKRRGLWNRFNRWSSRRVVASAKQGETVVKTQTS